MQLLKVNCIVSYDRSKAKTSTLNASKRRVWRLCYKHFLGTSHRFFWILSLLVHMFVWHPTMQCYGTLSHLSAHALQFWSPLSNSLGTLVQASRCYLREARPWELQRPQVQEHLHSVLDKRTSFRFFQSLTLERRKKREKEVGWRTSDFLF